MKKFKFVIILCILFLSGCTATYEVNIKDDKVIESLKIIETNQALFDVRTDTGWTLRETFDSLLNNDKFSEENYEVESLSNNNQLGIRYSSSSNSSILNSSILNQCYINPSVTTIDGIVTIDTGNDFKCYEYYNNLETVKIVFKTNHEVISTNAEEINGNSYIWNFTSDSNKQIKISYYEDFYNNSINVTTIIIIIMVVAIVGFGAYLLIKRNKEMNKI